MNDANAHCGHCGARYAAAAPWPRECAGCGRIAYRNPAPVAVLLVPVHGEAAEPRGLLVVQRGIPPQRGHWALPGGFIDFGESWQEAARRELFEETHVALAPEDFTIQAVHSTPSGAQVLLFCRARAIGRDQIPRFSPSREVSALDIIRAPRELAFPLHTAECAAYFASL